MSGLYLHIPFCRKACYYCNFHFSTSLKLKEPMVAALRQEITLQADYLKGKKIQTVYFGGGTPSVLEIADLNLILNIVRQTFTVDDDAEITIEANPEDIDPEKLIGWKAAGINRLSIGVQGFQDAVLKAWNRVHDSAQALASLRLAKEAGFDNISADLIYGDPELTDEDWSGNIQKLIELQIPHLSCYALTVETGTALHHHILKGKSKPLDETQSHRQYVVLQKRMKENGYEQYEISNFALPGYKSRHNTSYWTGQWYLGIGPSAHSFNGVSRQWNVSNNVRYIKSIESGIIPFELELLSPEQRYNEWVMTGLRTS
ncbi:MAG TPA: radical SAM family heme chaperone HemW, partial [Saprospiraceae bacterium]|nr:radical SAM family heme chaperone HemW [Saprospiraceae bacterium]